MTSNQPVALSAAPNPRLNHDDQAAPWWFSLRGAVLLAVVLLVVRLLYLFLISPYELDGDEAQYWEWSRRLQLSYYTKGPGVAWTIFASTFLFGATEAGVRVPAAICSCITMIALARLGYDLAGRSNKAAFYTAAAYTLTPAYLFTSQFMTIDMPYFMCASLAALAAFHALRPDNSNPGALAAWAGLGLAIGIGCLYKYTILLMLPGLAVYFVAQRKALLLNGRLLVNVAVMLVLFIVAMSPVIIWNHIEGWPTVSHLLGHVHMPGGDSEVRSSWSYDPMWTLEGIGTQLGALGLPMVVLMILAVLWAWRGRKQQADRWPGQLLMVLLGAPTLVFYLVVAFLTEIEGNWPLAGYLPLLPLVGVGLAVHMPIFSDKVRAWRALPEPRPKAGLLTKRPQTPWQAAWFVGIAWGVLAAIFILFAPFGKDLLLLDQLGGYDRVTGQSARAQHVHDRRQALAQQLGEEPVLLAYKYRVTATLAFYLPDRPSLVYCGQHYFGSRRSPYDYFEDTDLMAPDLRGKPFMLIGLPVESWRDYFVFDEVMVLDADKQWYLGTNYQGPADWPTD